jgi:predicted TIM-barrel fold metal-dependent hydrolase
MGSAGVERAAIIPAAWDVTGNELVLAAASRYPDQFAAFVVPELRGRTGAASLEAWRQRGASGLRIMFPPGIEPSWLADGTADWLWPAAAEIGLPLMVWAPGRLDAIREVALGLPRLRLLIDHLNLGMEPSEGGVEKDVAMLCRLAKLPNVSVKASALPLLGIDAASALRCVVDAFGASRVFWGSDLGRLPAGYEAAVAMVAQTGWFRNETERELVLGRGFLEWIGWRAVHQ